MTVIRRNGVEWVAPRDGLAHALAGHELRALCGHAPTSPRYAWPIREFCAVCLRLEQGRNAERKGAA